MSKRCKIFTKEMLKKPNIMRNRSFPIHPSNSIHDRIEDQTVETATSIILTNKEHHIKVKYISIKEIEHHVSGLRRMNPQRRRKPPGKNCPLEL